MDKHTKVYYQTHRNLNIQNNLEVDCISREQAKEAIRDKFKDLPSRVEINTILNELPSVTPQEPVLDKIREQMKDHLRGVEITLEVLVENDPLRPKMEGAKVTLEECLKIIDKAESET